MCVQIAEKVCIIMITKPREWSVLVKKIILWCPLESPDREIIKTYPTIIITYAAYVSYCWYLRYQQNEQYVDLRYLRSLPTTGRFLFLNNKFSSNFEIL